MPCSNHPNVVEGLDACTRCGKSFCIDCLVGRKSGWFCGPCDAAVTGAAPPAAALARPAEPRPEPAPSVLPPRWACTNHPEVIDRLHPCSRCRKEFCPDCLVELKSGRFCAGCKTEAIKDMQSGVDQTQLPLAHLGRRFVALMIDGFVTAIGMMVLFIPVVILMVVHQRDSGGGSGDPGGMIGMGIQLIFQVASWGLIMAYRGFMVQKWGQTVGKMAMGIKVVNPDGSAVTAGQAWMRAFIELLVGMFCCNVGYLVAFFNKDKCAVHDMAAKTRVIRIS
jgi:uncharacterized RDD family membrane protein YckC